MDESRANEIRGYKIANPGASQNAIAEHFHVSKRDVSAALKGGTIRGTDGGTKVPAPLDVRVDALSTTSAVVPVGTKLVPPYQGDLITCAGCGVANHKADLNADGYCESCHPADDAGAGGIADTATPSFIKNDAQPSFCGTAPPLVRARVSAPNPAPVASSFIQVPPAVLVALSKSDETLWFLDHYEMFNDKRYKNVKAMIHDTAVAVREAVKAI